MRFAAALIGCLVGGCPASEPAPPASPPAAPTPSGPRDVTLTIKAPPDQLVETPQGLWVKAGMGTEEAPVVVKDGPASIAELGFARTWVDHPPCGQPVEVKSLELVGGERWLDRVRISCGERWRGELFFDLTDVIERQIEALRGAENPRMRLGLEQPPSD
ncbi:MAG: hypothetical protein VYB65_08870 [Myxococcota bacterium]|nr:hypothetical protein [Myxococcota bacterium]